jgi:hypothetical protein
MPEDLLMKGEAVTRSTDEGRPTRRLEFLKLLVSGIYQELIRKEMPHLEIASYGAGTWKLQKHQKYLEVFEMW